MKPLNKIFVIWFFAGIICIGSVMHLSAQPATDQRGEDRLREQVIKLRIAERKKKFDALIERTEQFAAIATEIEASYIENKKLTPGDHIKLGQAENLLKKIRKQLKVKNDNEDKDQPKNTTRALILLQESSTKLLSALKNTTHHSLSVVAVQSSNLALKVVRFLKIKKKKKN